MIMLYINNPRVRGMFGMLQLTYKILQLQTFHYSRTVLPHCYI